MRRIWIVLAASLALGAGECGKSTETSSDGTLTVKGVLTDEGVECPAMRDESGHLYTLSGSLGGFRQGDRVCVKGSAPTSRSASRASRSTSRRSRPRIPAGNSSNRIDAPLLAARGFDRARSGAHCHSA
jgi:hypothetical protein